LAAVEHVLKQLAVLFRDYTPLRENFCIMPPRLIHSQ